MRQRVIWPLMLLCLVLTGCSSIHEEDDVVERVKVGDRVPSFTIEVTDGSETTTFSTDRLTGETVIAFFNTWCPDCQRELPKLNQYYLQHKDDAGFQLVAISRAEDAEVVADFWKEYQLAMPYSAQTDRSIYDLFASSIVPRIYFCNAQGTVTRVYVEEFDF